MPAIPEPGRQKEEDLKSQANPDHTERPCFKEPKGKKRKSKFQLLWMSYKFYFVVSDNNVNLSDLLEYSFSLRLGCFQN